MPRHCINCGRIERDGERMLPLYFGDGHHVCNEACHAEASEKLFEARNAILGTGWAVAAKTPANLERYANCVTPKQYQEAKRDALAKIDNMLAPAKTRKTFTQYVDLILAAKDSLLMANGRERAHRAHLDDAIARLQEARAAAQEEFLAECDLCGEAAVVGTLCATCGEE